MHKPIKFIYALLIITIVASSLTWYLLREVRRNEVVMDTIQSNTELNSSRPLPIAFHTPTPDGPAHIVGAEIERIRIPGCKDCYADIIKKMDGASDKSIIKFNDLATEGVFDFDTDNLIDIRDSKNRLKIAPEIESIDMLETTINYIDNGLIGFKTAYEVSGTGPHPWREPGAYYYTTTNNKGELLENGVNHPLFDENEVQTNNYEILKHFYPNGSKLFNSFLTILDSENKDECYKTDDFPKSFSDSFRPNTKEVVYKIDFDGDYYCNSFFSGDIQIAIPIADILREVPQYVPKDSVLWRFKESPESSMM